MTVYLLKKNEFFIFQNKENSTNLAKVIVLNKY